MSYAYHLSVAVSDLPRAKELYSGIFGQLGWKMKYQDEGSAAFTDGRFDYWLVTADSDNPNPQRGAVGFTHFAVRVETQAEVDVFYKWLLTSTARVDIAPKAYPEYSDKYYAVFFFDADGNRLEVAYV